MISWRIEKSTPFWEKQVMAIAVTASAIAHTSLIELSAAMRP